MALWFKKKKTEEQRVLDFNIEKLNTELQNLSDKINQFKRDTGFIILTEIIQMIRNIEMLKAYSSKDEKTLAQKQGRIQALSDLLRYIESAIAFSEQKKNSSQQPQSQQQEVRNILRARRSDNQAGAAL